MAYTLPTCTEIMNAVPAASEAVPPPTRSKDALSLSDRWSGVTVNNQQKMVPVFGSSKFNKFSADPQNDSAVARVSSVSRILFLTFFTKYCSFSKLQSLHYWSTPPTRLNEWFSKFSLLSFLVCFVGSSASCGRGQQPNEGRPSNQYAATTQHTFASPFLVSTPVHYLVSCLTVYRRWPYASSTLEYFMFLFSSGEPRKGVCLPPPEGVVPGVTNQLGGHGAGSGSAPQFILNFQLSFQQWWNKSQMSNDANEMLLTLVTILLVF